MRCDELFKRLQNFTNEEIDIPKITEITNAKSGAWYARQARNSNIPQADLIALNNYYVGIDLIEEGTISIDYFPEILASCGVGCLIPTESKEKLKVTKDVISDYSPSKRYSIVNAYGDSMQPFIRDKDLLVVEHTTEQIKDGRVYIFRYENALYVKRLVNNITEVIAKSDNTEYKPVILDKKTEDFEIIGQIVGLIRDLR